MENVVGEALAGFEQALARFREALAEDPELSEAVFEGTREWSDLLTYKLVPHLAGQGCLVAAVAGGTNTGKSTVFNVLLGDSVSPVVNTAAATRHPVLAANARRHGECLQSKLVPEFSARAFEDAAEAMSHEAPEDALFVALSEALPDHLVVMDTPDVDSIDKQNWAVAEHIRAAGDVLVAVLTGEKYKDDRVIRFFKAARSSGRVIVPLMNKANPQDDFRVARKQLEEFCEEVGNGGACFAIAHDFGIEKNFARRIPSLSGGPDLREYLESLDVPAIKARVFEDTVAHFAQEAGAFLDHATEIGRFLRTVADEFEARAWTHAQKLDPAPGPEVGGLFHEFVQSKRGKVRRLIGSTSTAVVRGISAVGRNLTGAFLRRTTLTPGDEADTAALHELHRRSIESILKELVTHCIESSRNLREPAGHLLADAFRGVDVEAVLETVAAETVTSEDVSEEFRAHAMAMLQAWWDDHKGKRRVLEALDTLLAIMPAAIAAPISVYTGGVGVPEAMIVLGPLAAQFATRVMEYQFGDAMFDFLSPWKEEQQRRLERALLRHLMAPCLSRVHRALEPFEGETMADLRRCRELCLKA